MSVSVLRTIDISIEAVKRIREEAEHGELGRLMDQATKAILRSTGRLIVMGVGKSGHIGRKLAATFASTGTRAHFVHPTEASHGDLGMIDRSDVVLALSWSGETAELANIVAYSKRFMVPLIAITAGTTSTLAKAADIALVLPKIVEACPNGLAPTTSTLVQLLVGDALAISLLEARGFSASDFRVFHPGGTLGNRLAVVRDLMHRGDAMPIIGPQELMGEAVMKMTSFGFGVVGVVDKEGMLVGIVTDGDLRRHMSDRLLGLRVNEVMTTDPKTIRAEDFASDALSILDELKISVLFVLDAGRPVGIIHFLDLLRAGVI